MPTRTKSNHILLTHAGSVVVAIMSREVAFLFLLISFLFTFSKAGPENCLEFDIGQLEDYLSQLDFENVPTISMMIGGFKCPVTALPFGALKSDWARLLLLQNAQPRQSILSEKLGRLLRILTTAYFQMEERFDVDTRFVGKILRNIAFLISNYFASSGPNATARVNRKTNEILTTPIIVRNNSVSTVTLDILSTTFAPSLANTQTANEIEGTTVRSFNQTPTNRIKIKKLPIDRKIPLGNEFLRYIIAPPKLTTFTPVMEKGFIKGRSKKRGSSNTDIQKNFRWFYNFAHENANHPSNNLQEIDIRCAGRKSNDK
ncbi:uncharacterized protein LOC108626992 isoform X1 [Ceratina calcarata]|uniref:Uncharacterized protein LOC108626992 isoform X1 n=1 Tax=Ceratina calcarata TaxID=156304 RepID=A0AAJ7WC91_9HYME|nr:uncharacterized protein LOC108626992 isoform X1 [Ceratina calcarata]